MNIFKKFFLGAMIAAPLLFAPATTKAGPISDLLKELLGGGNNRDKEKHDPQGGPKSTTAGNSVPIDGGLVFLMLAGLGLGAKMIYDNKAKKVQTLPL